MLKYNRVIVSVLLLLTGCGTEAPDLTTATIQDVGLVQTSGPPLGDGVPPVGGGPGDGVPIVTQGGGWTGGPGAVKWHGGQWLIPYVGHPGAALANTSCDVAPRPDASVLIELVSSSGQVLGSSTVPATTANVVIRSWIVLSPAHTLVDGEQVVMRISPRDAATGAWTSAAQDMTVISCAVNVEDVTTLSVPLLSPFVTTSAPPASLPMGTSASTVVVPFSLPIGSTITATRAVVHDNIAGPTTLRVGLLTIDGLGTGAAVASNFGAASAGTGAVQMVASAPMTTVVRSGRWYAVEIIYATGTATASVAGAEVDYLP